MVWMEGKLLVLGEGAYWHQKGFSFLADGTLGASGPALPPGEGRSCPLCAEQPHCLTSSTGCRLGATIHRHKAVTQHPKECCHSNGALEGNTLMGQELFKLSWFLLLLDMQSCNPDDRILLAEAIRSHLAHHGGKLNESYKCS